MSRFTPDNAATHGRKGGQRTAERHGRAHYQRIGKLGFAATVAKHHGGNRKAYLEHLQRKALIAIDPAPWNGAWTPREEEQ
jgi:general stress protein YciG